MFSRILICNFILIFCFSTLSKGAIIKKMYRGTNDRVLHYAYELPPSYEPNKPSGVLVYFHGNQSYSSTNETNFESWITKVKSAAFSRNLVPVVIMSPDTIMSDDGSAVRAWKSDLDGPLVHSFLLSNLDGQINLDKSKVFLEGASQGTCFLDDFLRLYSENLSGGILGECGCWRGPQPGYDPSRIKRDWKVWIAANTGDFLHESSQQGFDLLYYMYGLDVRSDLLRDGGHCGIDSDSRDSALDWMMGKKDYQIEDTTHHRWYMVKEITDQYMAGKLKWSSKGGFVATSIKIDPYRTQILKSINGYEWINGPEIPNAVVDYGFFQDGTAVFVNNRNMIYYLSFDGIFDSLPASVRDSVGIVKKLHVTSNDDLLLLADTTLYMFDDDIKIALNGGWRKSSDRGKTWSKVTTFPGTDPGIIFDFTRTLIPVGNTLLLSLLIDKHLQMYVSNDDGLSWQKRVAPAETLTVLRYGGGRLAALSNKYDTLYVSNDTARTWKKTPLSISTSSVEVTPDGRILCQTRIGLHTKNDGLTWEHEPGLLTVFDFNCAGPGGNGTVAYSTYGFIFYYTDKERPPVTDIKKVVKLKKIPVNSLVISRTTKGSLEFRSLEDCIVQWFDVQGKQLGRVRLRKGQSIQAPVSQGFIFWKATSLINSKNATGSLVIMKR